MAYWDSLVRLVAPRDEPVNAYAATYPVYEKDSPQYPVPNPYPLMQQGYRANEVVYACIEKRASTIGEPPIRVYQKGVGKTPQEIEDHALRKLLENPCPGVTERMFWGVNEIYLGSSGFSCWEMEFNRLGEVIRLWPMRPDWCSFMRGNGRPIDRVRYQPYGLPPIDIPREKVLLFQYFDPLYPLLKGLSPTAIALRSIGVDNEATNYLKTFFQQGSVIAGLLSTDQSLTETEADRIRARWKDVHGGTSNWGDIAVLGKGSKYQSMGMTFRDMAFPELDGRDEARICMTFHVEPILISAKIGLDRSTYSNYGEARQAYYDQTVSTQWAYYQDEIRVQLLSQFEENKSQFVVKFDTSDVKALQENRDAKFTRAINAAKSNVLTRDEAREEMGYDPIDNTPVFVGPNAAPALPELPEPQPQPVTEPQPPAVPVPKPDEGEEEEEALKTARDAERKRFRSFARRRTNEGHPEKIAGFAFKHLSAAEQAALLAENMPASAWRGYP